MPTPTTADHHKPVSRYWADQGTRYFQLLQASGQINEVIAVLPVAATEQHGPHLPLKVDTSIADGIVTAALPHLPLGASSLFLPTQAIGFSPEHARFAGTLTLKAETLIRLWTDIGESVAKAGVKKLVFFNAHGGQANFMDIVARDLRSRLDMLVFSVNWYGLPLRGPEGDDVNALFSPEEHRFGIHAGDVETSLMLALCPADVDMAQARDFASTSKARAEEFAILGNGKSAKLAWQIQDYNAAGAVGNAGAATTDKGVQVLESAGKALAQLLGEIQRLPMSTVRN
ncbi:MAG: creatininase family protein [Rhodoferax sp.]|nr:creatininase family protein [Rhodoferax sp.]